LEPATGSAAGIFERAELSPQFTLAGLAPVLRGYQLFGAEATNLMSSG
jgi:hypothetical protein